MSPLVARRYRLHELLGEGGQGRVHAATDELCTREVAIKLFPSGRRSSAAIREGAILRGLTLPGVVQLLDEGLEGVEHYLVTERVHGGHFPSGPEPTPWTLLAPLARQLFTTLSRVHRAGIVHGDLKPPNVLVSTEGVLHVLDFGMAHDERASKSSGHHPIGGTFEYLAPEIILGQPPSPRSDLFAAGVMLFRAVHGHGPWPVNDLGSLIRARWTPLQPVLTEGLPPQVELTIRGLLSSAPDDRPRNMIEALSALGLQPQQTGLCLPWPDRGPPLEPAELARIFLGPERILHLPSDAAEHLFTVTGGDRQRVRAELESWIDSGIARLVEQGVEAPPGAADRAGQRIRIERREVDRLQQQGHRSLAAPMPLPAGLEPEDVRLLALLALAGPWVGSAELGRVLGSMEGEPGRSLERLAAGSLVLPSVRGGWHELLSGGALNELEPGERQDLHQRLAQVLAVSGRARTDHLIHSLAPASLVLDSVVEEAQASYLIGRLGEARALLEAGFHLVRAQPEGAVELRPALRLYTQLTLTTELPPLLAHAAWTLARSCDDAEVETLTGLLEASRDALEGRPEHARTRLRSLGPMPTPALETWRDAVAIQAARRLSVATEELAVQEATRRAGSALDPEHRARLADWRGHLRYRQARYQEAAELHACAQTGRASLHGRLSSMLNEANAWMEAGRTEPARLAATQAREQAGWARAPLVEARAWWLSRMILVRTRELQPPDEDLVEAVYLLGSGGLGAIVALNEAALAWRWGDRPATSRLAARASAGFRAANLVAPAVLCAAIAADAGDTEGLSWAVEHFEEADAGEWASVMVQAAALLYKITAQVAWADRALTLAATIDRDPEAVLDLLSLSECRDLLAQRGETR